MKRLTSRCLSPHVQCLRTVLVNGAGKVLGGSALQSGELELSSLKADLSVLGPLPKEASLFPEPEPKAARASHRAHS